MRWLAFTTSTTMMMTPHGKQKWRQTLPRNVTHHTVTHWFLAGLRSPCMYRAAQCSLKQAGTQMNRPVPSSHGQTHGHLLTMRFTYLDEDA